MPPMNMVRNSIILPSSRLVFYSCLLVLSFFILYLANKLQYCVNMRQYFSANDVVDFHSNQCQWEFDHYLPSSWESYWYNNITHLQTEVCSTLTQDDQMKKSIVTLEKIIAYQTKIFHDTSISEHDETLFSKMFYRYECSKSSSQSNLTVSQFIEPLVGLVRDPLTICFHEYLPKHLNFVGEDPIQSKRFLLLGLSAPYHSFPLPSTPMIAPWLYRPGAQKILFDLGASLFNGGIYPTNITSFIGAQWFYEYFRRLSLNFDRIVAFEYLTYEPKTYWSQIPDDLIGKLTFINTGVESSGKFNPWNILRSIAKLEDYVIVKLDIDQSALEMDLIREVLKNTSISSLIDEMFFEMHVTVQEMIRHWGSPPGDLKDTYLLFTQLRQLGIRMHSWP